MPNALIEKTLRELPFGASTWAVPWAMFLDDQDECWLNGKYGKYAQCEQPGGTVQMRVTRCEDGYVCDISRCDSRGWHRGPCYVGGADPIRVARLVTKGEQGW